MYIITTQTEYYIKTNIQEITLKLIKSSTTVLTCNIVILTVRFCRWFRSPSARRGFRFDHHGHVWRRIHWRRNVITSHKRSRGTIVNRVLVHARTYVRKMGIRWIHSFIQMLKCYNKNVLRYDIKECVDKMRRVLYYALSLYLIK